MKAFVKGSYLLILSLSILSCGQRKELGREEYIRWVNEPDNGLLNKKQVGNYTFIAQYKPLDMVVLGEFKNHEEITRPVFDSVKKEFDGLQYFVLKIGTSDPSNDMLSFGVTNPQEYYGRIEYFSTLAQNDIYLVDNHDTIACGLYHFERTYGVSPYNNLILGFETRADQNGASKQLHFNDRVLGNGMLIFSISRDRINKIPQLNL